MRTHLLPTVLTTTLVSWAVAVGSFTATPARADEPPTFERDIKPLFAKRCAACHNAKKLSDPDISAGLALDTFEAALAGTKEHKVIVPGKASESELYRRFGEEDEDKRMPLFERPLPAPQRELVRRWIDAGAVRGTPVAGPAATAKRPARRVIRSLDVVLPIETKAPPKTEGFGPGGAIQLALKAGPLPTVSALAFRGDGRLLAIGTYGAVVLWDLTDARPALILKDVPGAVHALAFSRDGKRIAVGAGMPAQFGTVRVYAVPDGTLLHDFPGHDDVVFGLAFRPDDAQLASASFDQSVRVWDLVHGRAAGAFHGHSDFVYDVAYTRDGRWLLSVSKDRTVKRIDAKTLKEARTYSGYNDDVLALAVEPKGTYFVTAGNEPQLRWWTIDEETPARRVSGHGGPVHQVAFSGDGSRVISAGGDSTVRVWDGKTGIFQRVLPGSTEWQYAVAISNDGRLAAAGGWDGLVRLWDAEAGKLRATILQAPTEKADGVEWLVVTPGGDLAASPGLAPLLRWRVGGVEVPPDGPMSVFARPDEVAHAIRGEAVAPPPFPKPKP